MASDEQLTPEEQAAEVRQLLDAGWTLDRITADRPDLVQGVVYVDLNGLPAGSAPRAQTQRPMPTAL